MYRNSQTKSEISVVTCGCNLSVYSIEAVHSSVDLAPGCPNINPVSRFRQKGGIKVLRLVTIEIVRDATSCTPLYTDKPLPTKGAG